MRRLHTRMPSPDHDDVELHRRLFSNAELLKDMPQHVLAGACADDLIESRACRLQVRQEKLLRIGTTRRLLGISQTRAGVFKQLNMPRIRETRWVPQHFRTSQPNHDLASEPVESGCD